jgi:tRNA modification GTPase
LTPPGAAAIATLALRGPRAWEIVRELFKPHSTKSAGLPDQPTSGKFWLGRLGEDGGDEVVVAAVRNAAMATIEIHCHGGPEVVRMLLDCLTARGAERCSWQEFEGHTNPDPLQAEATVALSNALTVRTAAILLDQYHGAFERQRQAMLAAFSNSHEEALSILRELARWSPLGRHLAAPWKVAVLGPPNVGKSSLVNALAGFERCVVSPVPGTTRDVVSTRLAVDGWPIEVHDTAGLRSTEESLEAEGVHRAREAGGHADLCLWVLDASTAPVWPEAPPPGVHFVVNKIDLPAAWEWEKVEGSKVSALTGAGIPGLCTAIAARLVPEAPPAGAAVPFTDIQCQAVEDALSFCLNGEHERARGCLDRLSLTGARHEVER